MNIDTKILIDKFLKWYKINEHSKSEDYYKETLTFENLSQMKDDELINFFEQFAKEGGKIQSGGQRTASKFIENISFNLQEFRQKILAPFNSDFKLDDWFNWVSQVKYFGQGLATIYLNRIDKRKYTVVNGKSIKAYVKLGYDINESAKLPDLYKQLHKAQQDLINKYPEIENFYKADALSHFLIGTEQGKNLLENIEKFTWVDTHLKIVEYLKNQKDNQIGLINLLKKSGATIFNDIDKNENIIELTEIDPFTFFCYIYKYKERRLQILQNISKNLNIPIPTDTMGIPSANPQGVWLFPYKKKREFNEIERLWNFFYKALANSIDNKDFDDILKISGTGKTKITEALFYINPNKFFPIDKLTINYLEKNVGISTNFNTYTEYLQILEKIKSIFPNKPFYEISYDAWLWANEKNKQNIDEQNDIKQVELNNESEIQISEETNYWLFQANPQIFNIKDAIIDNTLKTWPIKAHKDKIKKGDKVILWLTGNKTGCYALCSVISEVKEAYDEPIEQKYYLDKSQNELRDRVRLSIDFNFAKNPILKENLLLLPEFDDFKGGNQGTNFTATKEQYETIKFLHLLDQSNLEENVFNKYLELIERKKQVIFQGAPGTGKSYLAEIFAKYLTDNQTKQLEVIQFHSSYSYEDFIQGYRPTDDGGFALKDGIFMRICERARQNKAKNYVIIIDEINRGNLSKIFGELLYLLEYRNKKIKLTYSPEKEFYIPDNLYIIGTMNTADRSLAMVDYALRRRFSFITLRTDYEIIRKFLESNNCKLNVDRLTENIKNLNNEIVKRLSLGKGFEIGHSYFIKDKNIDIEKLHEIVDYEIQPLLEEYFFDDISEVDNLIEKLYEGLK